MIEILNYTHVTANSKEELEKVRLLFEGYDIPYYYWEEKYALITDPCFENKIFLVLENNLNSSELSWG